MSKPGELQYPPALHNGPKRSEGQDKEPVVRSSKCKMELGEMTESTTAGIGSKGPEGQVVGKVSGCNKRERRLLRKR